MLLKSQVIETNEKEKFIIESLKGVKVIISEEEYGYNLLEGFSKINILVGENNSGKSRILRKLFSQNEAKFSIQNKELDEIILSIKDILKEFQIYYNDTKVSKNFQHLDNLGNVNHEDLKGLINNFYNISKYKDVLNTYSRIPEFLYNYMKEIIHFVNEGFSGRYRVYQKQYDGWTNLGQIPEYAEKIKNVQEFKIENIGYPNTKKVYIPLLRGLQKISSIDEDKDLYANLVRKNYPFMIGDIRVIDDKNNTSLYYENEIFTGQTMYNELISSLLGNHKNREKIKKFEKFLSESFFNGKSITLIPHHENKVIYVEIGDTIDRKIYELGDGIGSIIIITFLMFLYSDEGANFYIEEPEITLHPGLQRKLIETMLKFPKHQYRLTTHSNHMLDLTLDYSGISVYKFSNLGNENFKIENSERGDESLLNILGVQNSSVFTSNSHIRVEGITDRKYIRQYLKMYLESENITKKIQEDIDYTIIEYGGNNITHWSFLDGYKTEEGTKINVKSLCKKMLVICDNDDGKAIKRKKILTENLKDRFILLNANEIENTLPIKLVIDYLEENGEEIIIYPNEKIFEKIKLGYLIDNQILNNSGKKIYSADKGNSKTIKDKLIFCNKMIDKLEKEKFSDLPIKTQEFTKKIYEFIISNS